MRIVAALGGNALLKRGEPLTADVQRENVKRAVEALAPIALEHDLVITHGNGPQVGLLALHGETYKSGAAFPLDVLDAETEGMIGYQIEQALTNILSAERRVAALLTQVEVDRNDPGFCDPSKPIGPVYVREEAERLAMSGVGACDRMAISSAGWCRPPSPNGFWKSTSFDFWLIKA